MTVVIKRDKKRERFAGRKLKGSIEAAAREAHLPPERVKSLVEEVSASIIECARCEKEIQSTVLRETVLTKLDATEPMVARPGGTTTSGRRASPAKRPAARNRVHPVVRSPPGPYPAGTNPEAA